MEVEAVTASEHVMDSVMEAREAVLRARCEARAMAFAYPPGDPRRPVMAYVELMMAEALDAVDSAVRLDGEWKRKEDGKPLGVRA